MNYSLQFRSKKLKHEISNLKTNTTTGYSSFLFLFGNGFYFRRSDAV